MTSDAVLLLLLLYIALDRPAPARLVVRDQTCDRLLENLDQCYVKCDEEYTKLADGC